MALFGLTIIVIWLAYRFFAKWRWFIFPLALLLNGLFWLHAHQLIFWTLLSVALITYDLSYRNRHAGRDPFYNNKQQ